LFKAHYPEELLNMVRFSRKPLSTATWASLVRAWNLSTETNSDVMRLVISIRNDLSTNQVVKTRRLLIELSATIAAAMKEKQESNSVDKYVRDALDLLDAIRIKMNLLLTNERMDKHRMGVVIKRLDEIRSLVTGQDMTKKKPLIAD
jgi:hypothetical protein